LLVFAATSPAERRQSGHLIVALKGGVDPLKLPRHKAAPVAVELSGRVLTSDSVPVPRVNWIRLELSWRGRLDTEGLPVCPRSRLENRRSKQALEQCRGAVVGHGGLFARIFLPGEPGLAIKADITAFNARTGAGRHEVLVQGYSSDPPVSFVIPFSIHHQPAADRTVLIALIRRSVGPWPHVANFHVRVARHFFYRGARRSYLSASCPAPKGFTAGFSLARATYTFQGGQQISVESVRGCRTRG
jgi:hypothetical protein